jgi:AcrR family transcriptional regulator
MTLEGACRTLVRKWTFVRNHRYHGIVQRQRTRARSAYVSGQHSALRSRNNVDRRVQKTQSLLRSALASLISEKPYEQIVVKEILDRANVGRSTFYTHFSDKDDLLTSSIHVMVETVRSAKLRRSATWHDRILWFSLPIFEYHYAHRHDGQPTAGDRGKAIHHDRLQQVLSDMITGAVRAEFAGRGTTNKTLPPELIVRYVASTFVLVLDWWLDGRNRLPPHEIDQLFRALVLPTLSSSRR